MRVTLAPVRRFGLQTHTEGAPPATGSRAKPCTPRKLRLSPMVRAIVGLGNPGNDYRFTPHNVGFDVVDKLAQRMNATFRYESARRVDVAKGMIGGAPASLLKPLTYMNLSGESVRPWADYYGVEAADILVVCDDIALPLGTVRLRLGGTDGGHKGLRSIIQHLGTTKYPRLRVGVAPVDYPMGDAKNYVLRQLTGKTRTWMEDIVEIAADAAELCVEKGVDAAMNKYNGLEIPRPA